MRKLKPMNENRSGHTAAVLNGNIYVIGGECGQSNWLNSVEKYDPEKDEWTKVASMSVARGFTGATVLGNHLYVVGGRDDVNWHNSIERYDPDADEWVLMTPMMERRAGHVVAAHQGSVYVFGGTNKKVTSRSVERFDPGTNTWTQVSFRQPSNLCLFIFNSIAFQIAIVNESRRRASAISHAGKLIIFGGFDGKSEMQDVDEFDIATNSWTKLAPMRKKRGYFSIVKLKWFSSSQISLISFVDSLYSFSFFCLKYNFLINLNALFYVFIETQSRLLTIAQDLLILTIEIILNFLKTLKSDLTFTSHKSSQQYKQINKQNNRIGKK